MLVLLLTCAVFGLAAYFFSRGTVKSGLLRSPDVGLNTIGLVTANITAGTGFVYLLLNGAKNGVLACLLPLALLAGYAVLARLLARVDPGLMRPNFLEGCAREIERVSGSKTVLRRVLIVPLLVIFLLLFAFELFATSQLLAGLIDPASGTMLQIVVAGILLATTLSVCLWGGEGMLRTERLQAAIIAVCVVSLVALAVIGWRNAAIHQGSFPLLTDAHVITALIFAAVGAFNTQLYSVLNWNAVASVEGADRSKLLRRTSLLIASFAVIVLAVGASMPAIWGGNFAAGARQILAGDARNLAAVLFTILISGVAAITLTTTQGIAMAVAAMSRDSRGMESGSATTRDRAVYSGVLVVAVLVLGAFFFFRPALFYLLLAVVSGAEAVMPLIVTLLVLGREPARLARLGNAVLWPYLGFFALAISVNLVLTRVNPPLVPVFGLLVFALSCAYSCFLCVSPNGPRALAKDA